MTRPKAFRLTQELPVVAERRIQRLAPGELVFVQETHLGFGLLDAVRMDGTSVSLFGTDLIARSEPVAIAVNDDQDRS